MGGVVAADRVKPSLAGLLLSALGALRRAHFLHYAPPRGSPVASSARNFRPIAFLSDSR